MTSDEFMKYLESIGGIKNGNLSNKALITNRYYFSVGDGWLYLIKEMMDDIIKMGWNKEVYQVKEKFGLLKFYIGSASKEIQDRIAQAENDSMLVCEICGESGKKRTRGWIKILCNKHNKQRENERKQRENERE